MADVSYTYLGLCNKVLLELNEVPFEDEAEFLSAVGFHASVKTYINDALEAIYNEEENRWPFQLVSTTQVLSTDGTVEYALNANSADIDWESFYIEKDDTLDPKQPATSLPLKQYAEYRDYDRIDDLNRLSTNYSTPKYVVRTPSNKFAVSPTPDQAYTINYDYFDIFTPLSLYTDVPSIPERYKRAIIEGAKQYAFEFRDNYEQQQIAERKFMQKVDKMRTDLIPQADTVIARV